MSNLSLTLIADCGHTVGACGILSISVNILTNQYTLLVASRVAVVNTSNLSSERKRHPSVTIIFGHQNLSAFQRSFMKVDLHGKYCEANISASLASPVDW